MRQCLIGADFTYSIHAQSAYIQSLLFTVIMVIEQCCTSLNLSHTGNYYINQHSNTVNVTAGRANTVLDTVRLIPCYRLTAGIRVSVSTVVKI